VVRRPRRARALLEGPDSTLTTVYRRTTHRFTECGARRSYQ